jgi:hypothetical protein
MSYEQSPITRRRLMCDATRYVALGGIASFSAWLLSRQSGQAAAACPSPDATCSQCSQAAGCRLPQVWQLDPNRCIACGRCQTNCVLDLSAVKAVNCFALCGYCDICTGYFPTKDYVLDTGAENQLCPTGAITRKYIDKKGGVRVIEGNYEEYQLFLKSKAEDPQPAARQAVPRGKSSSPEKSPSKQHVKSHGKQSPKHASGKSGSAQAGSQDRGSGKNGGTETSTAQRSKKRRFPYRKLADIEGEIFQRESRIEQINEELGDQATFRDGGRVRALKQELAEQQSALKKLYEHWEEASEMNW